MPRNPVRGPKGRAGGPGRRPRPGPAQGETTTTERSTSPRSHPREGVLDLVDPDGLGDEAVEVELSVQVEVHEHGEVPRGEAVAVPARLQRAAAAEELDHGQVDAHVGRGDADLHQGPGQVARHEGLLHHRRVPHRLDADVGPVATREGADRLDRVGRAGVDGVRRAERRGGLELSRVEVDGDDGGRTGQLRPGDGGAPDSAAAEDRHRVAQPHLSGEHGRPEARHDAAAEQAHRLGPRRGVDLGALAGRDERLVREGADAEGGGERGAVGQRHLLRGVVGREAVPGPSPPARPALAAHGPPIEDDEVARRQVGDAGPDGLHEPGGLVPEEEGKVVVDAALAVVQVGVADAAGLDGDHRLARPRVGYDDRLERDRRTLLPRDHPAHLLSHARTSRRRALMMPDGRRDSEERLALP